MVLLLGSWSLQGGLELPSLGKCKVQQTASVWAVVMGPPVQ